MLSKAALRQTAEAIAAIQLPSGSIPWGPGRHSDPWNHIEAAMGLDAAGLHDEARCAYVWSAQMQREDGSWAAAYLENEVFDPTEDANFTAYVAAGAWHHFLATGDRSFLDEIWPVVRAAIDNVLTLQRPDGAIDWARDSAGERWPEALLTSSACILLSLRCAIAHATDLGIAVDHWGRCASRLAAALREGNRFAARDRYAMDWYYPVLSGVLGLDRARAIIDSGWAAFVKEGRGSLCVLDEPWVTAGESAELALACTVAGRLERAADLLGWLEHLRDEDGLYWTGRNHTDDSVFPYEKTTWSAGAVLLAADAVHGTGRASSFFQELGAATALAPAR